MRLRSRIAGSKGERKRSSGRGALVEVISASMSGNARAILELPSSLMTETSMMSLCFNAAVAHAFASAIEMRAKKAASS